MWSFIAQKKGPSWDDLVFVAVVIIFIVVGAIRNAIKQAMEKERQRRERGERRGAEGGASAAPPFEAAKDEMQEFLRAVREAAERGTAGVGQARLRAPERTFPEEAPPAPQRTFAQEAPRRRPPAAAARPSVRAVRPRAVRPAAAAKGPPAPERAVMPGIPAGLAPGEVPIVVQPLPVRPPAARTWLDRLPGDPLQRAVVLKEVLGTPLARRDRRRPRFFGPPES